MLLRLGAVVEIELFEEGQRDSPGERRSRPRRRRSRRRRAAPDVRALAGRADTTTRPPPHSLSRSRFLMPEAARQQGPALFPSGVVCDRFRIDGVLGVGGTGTVFRALDLEREEIVALKAIPHDATLRQRARREASVAGKLRHPERRAPAQRARGRAVRLHRIRHRRGHGSRRRAAAGPARRCGAAARRRGRVRRARARARARRRAPRREARQRAARPRRHACACSTSASRRSTSPTRPSTTACSARSPTWRPRPARADARRLRPTSGPSA